MPLVDKLTRLSALGRVASSASSRLATLPTIDRNPGALDGFYYVPDDLLPGAPLVVALHGCTQTAADYDRGTGWSTLAEREGFALLLPQQTRSNNPNTCFNWFQPADIARDGGEAESIALTVDAMVARHGLDPARVFVTGLSAGGAMAAVMLATHPDRFAAGAVIGGLPYATARGVGQALERMRGGGQMADEAAVAAVRRAAPTPRSWPHLSVWHGTADATVSHDNMTALGRQWRGVHGLSGDASVVERGSGWERRMWYGSDGKAAVEEWSIQGMGHGVPIDPRGDDGLGATGPYMLDVGLSSTRRIAESWGLAGEGSALSGSRPAHTTAEPEPATYGAAFVQDTIERALRSAGLGR